MSEIKLKPCPFCGNEKIAILTDSENPYFLACCSAYVNGCGATGGEGRTVQEAADKWNKRVDTDEH